MVAVVTGGASGIGRAITERFAEEGAAVVIADVLHDQGIVAAATVSERGGEAVSIVADITESLDVMRVFEAAQNAFGPVDILVNNAYSSEGDDILSSDEEQWDSTIAGVAKGAYLCSRAVLPSMIQRRAGAIVTIASVNGLAFFGHDAYSAGKAALISLTRSIAVRYGRFGIRANAVAPGTIRTRAWDSQLAESPDLLDRVSRWYPLGRIGEPADVANAAAFLASREAEWITGIVLPVDGGLLAGNYQLATEVAGE